jgi:hypothetical protein
MQQCVSSWVIAHPLYPVDIDVENKEAQEGEATNKVAVHKQLTGQSASSIEHDTPVRWNQLRRQPGRCCKAAAMAVVTFYTVIF